MGCFFLPRWTAFFKERFLGISVFESLGENGIGWLSLIAATFCLMYVWLTFGILFPKKVASKYPDGWAYTFISYIQLLRTLLYPLTWLIAVSANLLLRLFGLNNTDEQTDVTEEEIISMVNEGHEHGVLEAGEVEMITNIFEFGDKEASDIMTHRNNITAIDSTMPFKDALNFMLEESNSRYPVYEENLDHIIGVLYLKDAMRIHTSNENLNQPVGQVPGLFREAVFVPETKNIDDLFRSMQSEKNQMVIVMDEYGQTSGLVTMEDILEEIVGNIMDEYDSEENHIEEKGENEYVIEGMTRLKDLEERFGISFGETEFETLNGYIISKLDRIPDENENFEVEVDGYNFKIVKVEKNVIQSVLVTRVSYDDKR
jgi:putative hemolysin